MRVAEAKKTKKLLEQTEMKAEIQINRYRDIESKKRKRVGRLSQPLLKQMLWKFCWDCYRNCFFSLSSQNIREHHRIFLLVSKTAWATALEKQIHNPPGAVGFLLNAPSDYLVQVLNNIPPPFFDNLNTALKTINFCWHFFLGKAGFFHFP